MKNIEQIPVVIVGAGPAGLSAALFLARQGINVRVIERHAGTSIHPRARGLNVRTMEIYRTVGLELPIERAGEALAASRYMLFVETLAGQEIRRVLDDELVITGDALADYTPCSWVQCAQDDLEPLVLDAARHAGADVRFGIEVVGLTQDEDGVRVEMQDVDTGEVQRVQAEYVIAADGAKGGIRESLGIEVAEQAVQGHYVNIYFRADLQSYVRGREFAICFVETPAAPGIFLAVNNTDRWLFNAEYNPETTSQETFTRDHCIELVRAAAGIPELPVEVISVLPWDATAQYATRMQAKRVFLVGDAAHTMPPAGGFGLNTGVADTHNLAWKLALVLQKKASPTLLETYEAERLPVAKQLVEQAIRELTAERPDAPPDGGFESGLVAVLGFAYDSTAVWSDETPSVGGLNLTGQPGTRIPHVWLERDGKRISTLDLVDEQFVLLVGPEGSSWRQAVEESVEQMRVPVAVYQIGGEGIRDLSDTWCEANGVGKTGAVLVRPDGVVAWRTERVTGDGREILMDVLAKVLGKMIG